MAGPFPIAESATAYIDTLIDAGPLCDYEDEHGNQSCWVQLMRLEAAESVGIQFPCGG
jgi:hypothetical protein